MAYDDEVYIQATTDLEDAVWKLMENECSANDVKDIVNNAIANFEE
jgi:hypothetical protein